MVLMSKARSRLAAAVVAIVPAIALMAGCATTAGDTTTGVVPVANVQPAGVTHGQAAGSARAAGSGQVGSAVANGSRKVTFVNKVKQTIWVAASPDASHPIARTGWILRPGHSVTVTIPNHWNGRFWGRTGCVFHAGRGHCATGDCDGKFQCPGYGSIPATLAEYNLDAWDNLDFYDVSMVDGSNLPMYINVTKGKAAKRVSTRGCMPAGCTKAVRCPRVLQVRAGGKVVACKSACARFGTDQYCCRGKWAARSQCNPAKWPVDYAAVFKRAEPYAYSYADDDATSVYVCSGRCDYRIVFGVTPRT